MAVKDWIKSRRGQILRLMRIIPGTGFLAVKDWIEISRGLILRLMVIVNDS
jgi:hypothetical protein